MRVLMLTDDLPQGGAERQFLLLARGLRDYGAAVEIMQCYPHPVFYSSELKGLEVKTMDRATNPLRRVISVVKIVRKVRPDAVIVFKEGMAMTCCIARMFTDFRLIVSERNTVSGLTFRQRLKYLLFRKADHVVCNSRAQLAWIRRNYPRLAPKTSHIRNTIAPDTLPMADIPRKGISSEPLTILTVARLAPQKNPERWLRAAAIISRRYPYARFLWVGRSESESYRKQILKLREDLALSEIVEILPERTDVAGLYSNGDIFLLPSLQEGFSNALCEAVASGLPVVASDAGDNADILGDKRRIFNPLEETDIADKVSTLIQDLQDTPKIIEKETAERCGRLRELCGQNIFIDSYLKLIR